MKQFSRFFLIAVAGILLAAFAVAQAPLISPFSADLQISSTRGGKNLEATGQVFSGKGHIRMNLNAEGHETVMITDFATRTTDILLLQQKIYIEQKAGMVPGRGPQSMTQDLKPYDPDHPCDRDPEVTCKKIGVEEVNGRTCDHWQTTDKKGNVVDLWIDQKLHFPIKVTTPDASMVLSNLKEGEQDASLFQIPSDFSKMDMRGMMPPNMSGPPQN